MLQEVPKKINTVLVGEKTDFGSQLSWRPTYKGRERGEGGREALVLHKAPFHQSREEGGSLTRLEKLQPNPAACALQAAAAWQQGQESSSASIKALSTSTRSKQGLPRTSQGLSQVPKWRPCLPGRGGPTLASQPEACLPNKETKAFLGPGLRMVTSLHSLPLPCARHCTKPWMWIDSWTLTATGRNQGTERLSA